MYPSRRNHLKRVSTGWLLAACVAGIGSSAFATSLNWDVGNGTIPQSGDWDTTTFNWTTGIPIYPAANSSTNTYTDGAVDDVTFFTTGTNGTATITLPGGGLTPQSITISGTTSAGVSYTFAGGPFVGSAPLNVATGLGPTTTLTVAAPNWSGPITVGKSTNGAILISNTTGAFGTGQVTMLGPTGNAGTLRFGTSTSQTIANDIELKGGFNSGIQGNGAATQTFTAFPNSSGVAGYKVTFTGNIIGNDDNLYLYGGTGQARVVEFRPGTGKSVTGTGTTTIVYQGLSISDNSQMLGGNLALSSGGTLIFDNLSYSSWGRTNGTGANQWRIAAPGGGFAARGQDVTITSGPGTLLDSNMGIGFGDVSYADHAVIIQTGNTQNITANRQLYTWGGVLAYPNQRNGLTFIGPINEIADQINTTGNYTLTVAGFAQAGLIGLSPTNAANSASGGVVRFSNASNNIYNLQIGANNGAGVVVLTNTGAGGGGTINVGTNGIGGSGGYLFFEDMPGTGTTFSNNFNVNINDTTGNWNNAGFGSVGGDATFIGTATLTTPSTLTTQGSVSANFVPINVLAGSLILGNSTTAATLTNNRSLNYTGAGSAGNYNGMIYTKNNTGEIVLNNIDYSLGTNTNGWRWRLVGGIITTESMGLISSPGGLLSDTNIIPADIFSQNTSAGRGWRTTTVAQSYVTNGNVTPTGDFLFDNQSDLTLDIGSYSFFGSTAGAQLFRKTGAGTLMLKSTTGLAGNGDTSDYFQIEAGTLDVKGNTGNTSFRVQGGTLLSSNVSGFVSGRTLEITAAGGKVGVSVNATANVTRSATAINSWTQGGTVTFASRDNYNLAFTNAGFPDITAGTVLFERDGTGSGVVQINDTAVDVSGANTRVGGSGEVRFGAAGTGTWTFSGGTLAPGSSPGILTVDGNIVLTSAAAFEVQIYGTTLGTQYDQLALSAASAHTITLGNADLLLDFGYFPSLGDTFVIIDNQHASGVTSGLFTYNAGTLLDDQEFLASYNGNPFKLTIDYNGGIDGNDVILTTTFIPEPASLALLAAGGLLIMSRSRKL